MLNNFIWHIDKAQSGATTPDDSGPGSNGNKGVLHIFQISKGGASPSDELTSYLGHSFGEVLLFCKDVIGVFYSPSRLGSGMLEVHK